MNFVTPDESEFFDSYGFPPETYDMDEYVLWESTYFNDKPLQGLTSDVCGDYCLFYLLHRARNVDLNTIQTKFKRYDSQWNDAQVAQFVHSFIQSITNISNGSGKKQTSKNFYKDNDTFEFTRHVSVGQRPASVESRIHLKLH